MNDGRLDEAYRLAEAPKFRAHRKGQALVQRLAELYERRASDHLANARLDQARLDADRARQLAGNTVTIVDLLVRIAAAAEAQRHAAQLRQQQADQARHRLEAGEYSLAMNLAQEVGESAVGQLQREANCRQRDFATACRTARRALDWKAWPEAVQAVRDAGKLQPRDEQYAALRHELIAALHAELEASMQAGRLDRAGHHLTWLTDLGADAETLGTWRRALSEFAQAVRGIQRSEYAGAGRHLRAARQLFGPAEWLDQAIATIATLSAGRDEILSGPLRWVIEGSASEPPTEARRLSPTPQMRHVAAGGPIPRPDAAAGHAAELPAAGFVLHVGSAPSALVVTSSRVRIGPVGRSQKVDIPLTGAGMASSVVVERLDDDYFLRADEGVKVNGQRVVNKLLQHGDTVHLGQGAGLVFHLPCPASSSAVLEVVGARLPRADTRHVVLLSDTLVVGPHRQSHLPHGSLSDTLVIQNHGHHLAARAGHHRVEVPWGQTVEVAGMPVTAVPVTPWS